MPRDAGAQPVDGGVGAQGGGAGACTGFPPFNGPTGGAVFSCPFLPVAADIRFPNESYVVSVRAPVPECRPVPLSVSVAITAPGGTLVPPSVSPAATADQFGGVSTAVRFTPPDSGTFVVQAVFEPSLGEARAELNITGLFDERGVFIAGVTDCIDAPWPLGGTTLACETDAGIALYPADGGRLELEGINLVTTGDVIWSLRDAGSSYALQRHVWTGSSLALTDEWSGEFSTEHVRGLHTTDMAIRLRKPLAQHRFLMVARAGGAVQEAFIPDEVDAGSLFSSETAVWDPSSLVAFTTTGWVEAPPNFTGRDCGFVARVISRSGFPYGLPAPAHPTPAPEREFETWPLWVDISSRTMLFANSTFTEWPLSRVVRVGSTHVVVSTDGGFLLSPIN
ncbi:MAG: hypothetical protein QM817_01660 [Archangium sp.]